MVRDFHTFLNEQLASNNAWIEAKRIDYIKVLQLILSKNLPPERYNAIINLYYVLVSEQIESALINCFGLF